MDLRFFMLLPLAAVVQAAPVHPAHVLAPFQAPAHRFAPGHRGVDLAATPGQRVVSPLDGVIAFSGSIAGRPVVTVRGGTRIASMEPVVGQVAPGSQVSAGDFIGLVGKGGHCSLRCVHLGLRIGVEYVNPLRRHARLLP